MEIPTITENLIDSVGYDAKYDKAVKQLLGNKEILALILKFCVAEFSEYDHEEIVQCIEGNPDIATKAVHPNDTDEKAGYAPLIAGQNTEDSSISEGTIYYDVKFTAIVPKTKAAVQLLINIEAQTDPNPGYRLENRVVYYLSRLISGQYGTVFTKSEYGKMEKVYSIWFCSKPPQYKRNTITGISLTGNVIYGNGKPELPSVDFMQGIIVNLGDSEDEVDNMTLKLMNTLLSEHISANEKKRMLNEEFNITMTEKLESEVQEMCNLSQGIRRESEARGETRGKEIGRLQTLFELVKDGFLTTQQASVRAQLTEDQFKTEMTKAGF